MAKVPKKAGSFTQPLNLGKLSGQIKKTPSQRQLVRTQTTPPVSFRPPNRAPAWLPNTPIHPDLYKHLEDMALACNKTTSEQVRFIVEKAIGEYFLMTRYVNYATDRKTSRASDDESEE